MQAATPNPATINPEARVITIGDIISSQVIENSMCSLLKKTQRRGALAQDRGLRIRGSRIAIFYPLSSILDHFDGLFP
jgi:hypothetical protein